MAATKITDYDLDGYEQRPPPQDVAVVDGQFIDRQVAAQATCSNCGHRGLSYRPFVRPGSYRAFAVCPRCEHAEEF